MINLDPNLVNQDAIRKKRRKKMLSIAVLPVILFLLMGFFFLRPGVFDMLFSIQFNNGNSSAVALSQFHKNLNLIESYIAYYDAGTAYIKNNDNSRAEEELRESIRHNPPSDKICIVRVNLSYSIEMQADEARAAERRDEALLLYNRAESVLYEDNCASKEDSKSGKDQNADNAKSRISQKKTMTVEEINDNGGSGNEDGDNGSAEISDEEADQLRGETLSPEEAHNIVNGSVYRNNYFGGDHW